MLQELRVYSQLFTHKQYLVNFVRVRDAEFYPLLLVVVVFFVCFFKENLKLLFLC